MAVVSPLYGPNILFFRCFGRAVFRDCGISGVPSPYILGKGRHYLEDKKLIAMAITGIIMLSLLTNLTHSRSTT